MFKEFLDHLKQNGDEDSTIKWYKHKFEKLLIWSIDNGYTRGPFTLPQMQEFFAYLKAAGLSPYTVRAYWKALDTFGRWAVENGHMKPDDHIIPKLPFPKVPKENVNHFSLEEISALLAAIDRRKSACNARDKAWLLLALDTGLRREALRMVKAEDVNLESRTVRAYEKKTGIVQMAGIGDKTADAIAGLRIKKGYLFATDSGAPMSGYRMWKILQELCERAGIPRRKLHAMRYTFGCLSIEDGMSATDVQNALGHTTPQMTQHYIEAVKEKMTIRHMRKHAPSDRLATGH